MNKKNSTDENANFRNLNNLIFYGLHGQNVSEDELDIIRL
jgi:hypothetical protein